jgi:shikimate dehydrogenase
MTTTDRYGVMGYPVSHSRSPVIHRLFALQTNQTLQYELLQVTPEKLSVAVRQFQRTGGKGLNITVPHKAEVIKLCDQLSERASSAGAANTLTFRDGEIHGENTDGIGLLRDLVINLGITLEDANILILGAGGATRGIVAPLLEMQPASLRIANRTLDKAQVLADHFSRSGPVTACRFNMVPVSDKWARAQGAEKSVMGWGMLVEQAAESFHIWRGVRPETAPVLKQMKISA